MAEIPRQFLQPQGRGAERVTGGLASAPPGVRVGNSAALIGQAGEQLGGVISQAGARFQQLNEQQVAEREAVESAQGVSGGLIALEELNAAVQNDGTIAALDKATTFRDRAAEILERQTAGIKSERVRAQVELRLGSHLAAKFGALNEFGQREFKAESGRTLAFVFEQGRRQLLEADTPEERQAILETLRGLGAQFVESGAVPQSVITQGLVQVQEGAEIDRMRLLISSDPRRSETHLLNLARGEGGVEGFPDVPLDEVRTLLEESRQVRRQAGQDELRAEQILDKEEKEREEATAIEIRSALFEDGATIESMRDVIRSANDAAAAGLLDEASHSSILSTARTLIDAEITGGGTSDVDRLNTLTFAVYGESLPPGAYVDLREDVQAAIQSGALSRKDGLPLLKEVDARSRSDHYSKVPEYREGVNLIRQAVGFSDTGLVLSFDDPTREIKARASRALVAYNDAINDVFVRGGRTAVSQSADQIAEQVVEVFGVSPEAQLSTFPVPPSLRGLENFGTPFERTIMAKKRLSEMRNVPDALKAAEVRMLDQRLALEEAAQFKSLTRRAGRAARAAAKPGFGVIDFAKDTFNRLFDPGTAPPRGGFTDQGEPEL